MFGLLSNITPDELTQKKTGIIMLNLQSVLISELKRSQVEMKNDRIGNPRVPSRRFPAGRAQTCAGAHPLLRVTSSKLV